MAETAGQTPGRNSARVRAAKARRRWLINLAVVAVILVGAGAYWKTRRASGAPQGVVTAQVERRDLVQVVSATGSVTAQTGAMVRIGSQITGRIKRLFADVGDVMKAGQVIAELDVPDLQAQVRQAEAAVAVSRARLAEQTAGVGLQNAQSSADIRKTQAGVSLAEANLRQAQQAANLQLATAQAGVRQARANANNAATNLARLQQLLEKGYVAAVDADNAKAQAEVTAAQLSSAEDNVKLVRSKVETDLSSATEQLRQAQATLAAARAGSALPAIKGEQVQQAREALRQAEAALAYSRAQFAKSVIRTPISGTVLQLAQQEGETIAAGLSAPTVIIVADLDRLQVDAYVDETDIGQVEIGQPAKVTVDAYPDRPFAGRVETIASGATMQQNVVTYKVTVSLDNPSHLLKPDMTASVEIEVGRRQGVLAVPVDAIKPTLEGPQVTVLTKDREGKPSFRVVEVRTGISDADHTEIQRGLREGDTVVLAGEAPGMSAGEQGPRMHGPLSMGGRRGQGPGGGRGR